MKSNLVILGTVDSPQGDRVDQTSTYNAVHWSQREHVLSKMNMFAKPAESNESVEQPTQVIVSAKHVLSCMQVLG